MIYKNKWYIWGMQKDLKIKTKDNYYIYGTLNTPNKIPTKLVIFVHGFTSHRNEHILFNGSKFLVNKGFDTFRFDLYGGEKGARNMVDCTISINGEDINTVVNYFSKKYKNIYVVGHSYGGTALLFVKQEKVSKFIFWDPSYIEKDQDQSFVYKKEIDSYVVDWGVSYIVGKKIVNELKNFPDCGEMISKFTKPVFFVGAEKGAKNHCNKYFKKASNPKELKIIKGADHNFNNFEHEEILFKETFNFINKK